MNKFSDENNFNNKEANKWVGVHGVIFDVDGTLLDSMMIWEEAAVRYLNSLGLEPEENLSEKIMTMSMEEGADYLIDHYGVSLTRTQILDGIRELIRGFYEDEVQLKPGVEQVIKLLASKGIPIIIATSSDSACVTAGLKRLGVWSYFKGILTLERERQNQIFILPLQKRLEVSLQRQLYLRTHFMLLLLQRMQALLLLVFMIHIIRTRRRLERSQTVIIRNGMK